MTLSHPVYIFASYSNYKNSFLLFFLSSLNLYLFSLSLITFFSISFSFFFIFFYLFLAIPFLLSLFYNVLAVYLFFSQPFITISMLLICCTVILTFFAIKTFKYLRVAQGLNKMYTRNSLIQSKQWAYPLI